MILELTLAANRAPSRLQLTSRSQPLPPDSDETLLLNSMDADNGWHADGMSLVRSQEVREQNSGLGAAGHTNSRCPANHATPRFRVSPHHHQQPVQLDWI